MHNSRLKPKEAIVAVNYRCNARCSMCDIWRVKEDGALTPDDYRRLPSGLENVGVTGGEPFMRRDIVELVHAVFDAVGRPQIIINTNGYLTGRIIAAFRKFRKLRPAVGIGISVDGIGRAHDEIRGTRGAFDKVMRTLMALKDENIRNVRLSFTITNKNVTQLPAVYDLARRLSVQFASTVAHNSDHYFHTNANRSVDQELLRQAYHVVNRRELSSASLKSWARAYYNAGVMLHNELGTRPLPCSAARDFFFLSPRGDVYPCFIVPKILGNILEAPFEHIWTGKTAETVRGEIEGCEQCWVMCTMRTALKKRPLAAGAWLMREQLKRLALQ